MTKRDWLWLVGCVLSAVTTFYATREGLIQEIRETNERLVRIEVMMQATALQAIGRDSLGPLPEKEE